MRSVKTVPELPVNKWPLNLAAKRWLDQMKVPIRSDLPYLVQFLSEGFEADLPLLGPGQKYRWELDQASGQLLSTQLDPVRVMRWFTSNPNGPDPSEQSQTLLLELEQAKTWQEAAQNLMEWFYDVKAARDPYF